MTDDSSAEKNALKAIWPTTMQLLCTFHFLQRRWTWLYDKKNKISTRDRIILMNLVKSMVYAKTDNELQKQFSEFQSHELVTKYNFLKHVQGLWDKRKEWALCYRENLPIRGNNTNNISEAGVRILKEIVLSRVKAYILLNYFNL